MNSSLTILKFFLPITFGLICTTVEAIRLKCSLDEQQAVIITYNKYEFDTFTHDDQKDLIATKKIIATPQLRLTTVTGKRLDPRKMVRGISQYNPYTAQEWTFPTEVYQLDNLKPYGWVRKATLQQTSLKNQPFSVIDSTSVKTFASTECTWTESSTSQQRIRICNRYFFGWIAPLFSETYRSGKVVEKQVANSVTHECVHRSILELPQLQEWRR